MDPDKDTQKGKKDGDTATGGETTGLSISQVFVQDLEGKTHILPFNPLDSIANNLLSHSSQLQLPPLQELYILSGRYILKTEEAAKENGLHHEPHLRVMLRYRGGMKGSPKSPPQGAPGAKGKGTRSPGGEGRQMGGSHGNEDNINHTPPQRGGRGRGRGSRAIEHKRPTVVHTGTQETMDDNELSASLKAIQETHRNMMIQHCRQSWEESDMTIGYGPPPTAAPPLTHRSAGPTKQNETAPHALPTPPTSTTTARKLKMEGPQLDITPAKERDPVKSKADVEGGTDYNSHAQEPTQGRDTGKANDRQQIHANPIDPTAGTSKQGAKKGGKYIKSRDSETIAPPPQAEAYIGNTSSEQIGSLSNHKRANTPYRPDDAPTNGNTEPTARDERNSHIKTVDTSNPLHQAETDLTEPPSGHEGLCPHGRTGKSERPGKKAGRKDSGWAPKQHPPQPCLRDRIADNGTEPPQTHPTTQKDEREQLLGPTAREHDLILSQKSQELQTSPTLRSSGQTCGERSN